MCERGVQLKNPFYSIWATEIGTNLALAFIIIAGICAGLYFCFLSFMVYKVIFNDRFVCSFNDLIKFTSRNDDMLLENTNLLYSL